jgi:beta-galactosidase
MVQTDKILILKLHFMNFKMKFKLFLFFLILDAVLSAQPILPGSNLLDFNWQFHKGGVQGAENPSFNDDDWRNIDLPHDWSIEDLPGTISPFDRNAISQTSGGFTTGGTGWYRKAFSLPADLPGKRYILYFEGIYMNATIWFNGREIGNHPYGYTSFWFDVTPQVKMEGTNLLAVKVVNEGENSRWYSGSGIYRHVWLKVLDPVHISQWGTYITTPEITDSSALVKVLTKVVNSTDKPVIVKLVNRIISPQKKEISINEKSQLFQPGSELEISQYLTLTSPELWSVDKPDLYIALTEVYVQDKLTDHMETTFGIRSISFDVQNGFLLNGAPLKMKGGCVHHDNGPLGAKAYDRAEERRVELLKASGFNAIRCAHNPPSPAFLDACDRLGMLVIDETFDMWASPKNSFDYHLWFTKWWERDVESMVLRDRNHPSVVMWSIGNEIPERGNARGVELAILLGGKIRELDPTRPVTSAVNGLNPDKDPYFSTLEIAGYNYPIDRPQNQPDWYKKEHERVPGRIVACTESFPLLAFGSWIGVLENPHVIGDFVWTSFDYIGEASIGWLGYMMDNRFFPWNLAYCGDIDICGWKRPQSFYRDVLWIPGQISVFVKPPVPSFKENPLREAWSKWHWHDAVADWNWRGYEGKPLEVSVYSNCQEAELFLNGKSLGKKKTDPSTEFIAKWDVPWEAGELKAVGYSNGKNIGESWFKTANVPVNIRMSADRTSLQADGQDLSYITVELTDKNGVRHPKAENLVNFSISGPGKIVAVGNANPVSLESYQLPRRKAWQGRCLVVVKSERNDGTIRLIATSKGLKSSVIEIKSL